MVLDFDRFLEGEDSVEKALMPSKLVFLQTIGTEFFEMAAYSPDYWTNIKTWFRLKVICQLLTFLLLIYHVMFAAGNDVPTVHVALRLSFAKRVFFSTIMRGSSFGSSITCITAVRMSVWNNGASSDTSHWNWPVKSLVTPLNVTDVASEWANCEKTNIS